MNRFANILTILATLMLTTAATAVIKTERIEYKHGETVLEGVMAYDDSIMEKRPGVLVCHEWWGCNEYAESRAKQLAELGYVAFALDMYGKGKTTTKGDEAGAWLGKLMQDPKAMRERAGAGLKILAESPRVNATKLAVIGYCMGGTIALELARSGLSHTENLRAVVPFHASVIAATDAADNKNIKGSILVCHGQADDFVKPEQIVAFHKQMSDAKIDYEFISFGGAVHAFTNPAADGSFSPSVKHDPKADKRSWGAMRSFLSERFAD